MYHIFIHSSVDGDLSCFHVLATVINSVAVNIGVHISFRIRAFSEYTPRSGLLDHMVVLFLVFYFFLFLVF